MSHEPPADILAACRELLARQRAIKHWHGGPDRCPSCGGLPVDWQKPPPPRAAQLHLVHNRPDETDTHPGTPP